MELYLASVADLLQARPLAKPHEQTSHPKVRIEFKLFFLFLLITTQLKVE